MFDSCTSGYRTTGELPLLGRDTFRQNSATLRGKRTQTSLARDPCRTKDNFDVAVSFEKLSILLISWLGVSRLENNVRLSSSQGSRFQMHHIMAMQK